jgi:membrane protein DedA with SNARE-associated domain
VLESIVEHVFDPLWNAEHRALIYGTIVIVLYLSGVGLPLPEDLPLTATGFTTFKQAGDTFIWWRYLMAFAMTVTPILIGDVCAYSLGRRFGMPLRDRFRIFRRALNDQRVHRVERWFHNYGSFTVFLGRQVAGVRFVTFYTAGIMRMKLSRFILWDFMGCLVSVPVWLTLGTLAARYGRPWLHAASRSVGSTFVLIVVAAAVGLFVFAKLRAAKHARQEQP